MYDNNKNQISNEEIKLTKEQEQVYIKLPEEQKKEYNKYLKWVKTFYPVDEFEIPREDKTPAKFYRFNGLIPFDEKEKEHLIYFMKEENPDTKKLEIVATIWAFTKEKKFNFLVEWESRFKGYGTTIYNNVQKILENLGIEDREDYYVTVAHQKDHMFLKYMESQKLLEKTSLEANEENARMLLKEFENFSNSLNLNEVNLIIEYAKKSGISNEDIVNALNNNGCKINPKTIQGEELKKFEKFNLSGLKATSMHQNIMQTQSLVSLSLINDVDKKDFTNEFQKIFEDLKAIKMKRESENISNLELLRELDEVEYFILNFERPEILIRNVEDKIKSIVKKIAIFKLDYVDKSKTLDSDYSTRKVIEVLSKSMDLDKQDYINLAMKMINRNYTLKEYNEFMEKHAYFNRDVIREAKLEMSNNIYLPCPKKQWNQEENDRKYGVKKIVLPKVYNSQNECVRNAVKNAVYENKELIKMKIKTDMIGISKDNKTFEVDNLKDWMFGVLGAPGNMKISKRKNEIILPPQTPEEAIEMLKLAICSRVPIGPDSDVR